MGQPIQIQKRTAATFEFALAAALVLLIVVCRLGIHLPNFHPVMAVALFSGYWFSRRWLGLSAVLTGMILSDLTIGFYQWQVALVVYLALACPLLAGVWIKNRNWIGFRLAASVGATAVAGAILFYLATNIAVWAALDWYANDLSGLVVCLAMGLPFLKWTLLGNLVFSALLFGGQAVSEKLPTAGTTSWHRRRLAPVPVRRRKR